MMTGLIPKTTKPIDRVNSKCFHGMMLEKKPGICAIIVLDKDPSFSTLLMTLEKPF
jgi:hypothetical protein